MVADIQVVGLRDFQRELRAADPAWPKELRRANLDTAKLVADRTRASFAGRAGVAPKVAPSVKALAQQRNASVKIGGARFPFALGSNFGSRRFKQFPAPVQPDYSLYRTIGAERERTMDAYERAVHRLMREAFPD